MYQKVLIMIKRKSKFNNNRPILNNHENLILKKNRIFKLINNLDNQIHNM